MPILLQINVTANSGSHGKIAEEIGQLAIKHGWRSIIAYGRWANTSKNELIRIGTELDIKEHGVESRLFDNHGLASRRATNTYILQIKEIKPDVIHLHNIHGYYLNYRLLFNYLNSTDIPVVWTFHDCWPFTGHCAHFITAKCEKWKNGCNSCTLSKNYPKSYIDFSNRNYHLKKSLFANNPHLHIVAVSEWLAGLIRQSFFKDDEIRVIKNGVNTDIFRPILLDQNYYYKRIISTNIRILDKWVILGVASAWTEEKGLYGYNQLAEHLGDDEIIVLIGVNNNQKKKITSKIICIPKTEHIEELVCWYNIADVVLSLSSVETFGMTVVEGMACGTPAIVYNNTALPEIISEGTGLVVPNGDIQAICEAIKEIKRKGHEYYSMACGAKAREEFDKHKCFNSYVNLYEELIKTA